MSENTEGMLNDFSVTLELSVRELNILLNTLNSPQQAQTLILAAFIDLFQRQADPQIEQAKINLEAVKKATK
jgi:hypothetical protein